MHPFQEGRSMKAAGTAQSA